MLGALCTLAFSPFGHWWLLYPLLTASVVILHKARSPSFAAGWFFGFGYFTAGIAWVHVSIDNFGGLPLPISLLLMALLCGYLAIYFGLAFWVSKRFFSPSLWSVVIPFLWLLFEWLRAHFLTGFPWLSIGYSQIDSPLSPLFPVIGEIGVSAIVIMLCTAIAGLIIRVDYSKSVFATIGTCVLVITLLCAQAQWILPTHSKTTVSLVQGNIEQSIRWRPELDQPIIDKHFALTQPHWDSDIIVWPEAAIPALESLPLAQESLAKLELLAMQNEAAVVTGVVDYNLYDDEAFNFILAVGLDTQTSNTIPYAYRHPNRYAKHQLLPIGEFVPFESVLRSLAPLFDLPMSSFTRGDYVQPNIKAKGLSLVPALCYEIAFPNQLRANIDSHSDMIVTVSNDAWFGDSHGPHQHLQIARVRAVEFGLPVIRATNNGVTAAYDAFGKLLGKLPQFEDAVLTIEVPLVEGTTPYVRFGNLPAWIIASVMFFTCVFLQYTRSRKLSNSL